MAGQSGVKLSICLQPSFANESILSLSAIVSAHPVPSLQMVDFSVVINNPTSFVHAVNISLNVFIQLAPRCLCRPLRRRRHEGKPCGCRFRVFTAACIDFTPRTLDSTKHSAGVGGNRSSGVDVATWAAHAGIT